MEGQGKPKVQINHFPAVFLFDGECRDYYDRVASICRECLDDVSALESARSTNEICVVARVGEEIVGFSLVGIDVSGREASIDAIAVPERNRGKGYGGAMLDWIIGEASFLRCGRVTALAVEWKEKPRTNLLLFESRGFSAKPEVKDAFTEDSIRNGWLCKECGGVCHHSAIPFERIIRI